MQKLLRTTAGVISTWLFCAAALAGPAVSVTPMDDRPGPAIPADYLGISVETGAILEQSDGSHRFAVDNEPLLNLYRTLGVGSLRVGGNQVDFATVKIPDHADIDNLFAFAKADDLKVIYSFRLMPTPQRQDQDPAVAAEAAKYIASHYADLLDSFEIGNEPNLWPKPNKVTYEQFYPKWARSAEAIIRAVPDAKLSGPGSAGLAMWYLSFVRDAKRQFGDHLVQVNQHHYFGGSGKAIKSPTTARARLTSQEILDDYQTMYDKFGPACKQMGLGYRLEETNSLSRGGALKVSDTLASALWAVHYLHWWAQHDCQGINFHTGDWTIAKPGDAGGNPYSVYWKATDGKGYIAQPLAYAMKAFALGSHGRRVTVNVSNARDFAAYGVLGDDDALHVTLINTATTDVAATLPAAKRTGGDVYLLTTPNHDPAEEGGVTFGGATITNDGHWDGKPTALAAPVDGKFKVTVPSMSVAVVTLKP